MRKEGNDMPRNVPEVRREIYVKSLVNRRENLLKRQSALNMENGTLSTKISRCQLRQKAIGLELNQTQSQLAQLEIQLKSMNIAF